MITRRQYLSARVVRPRWRAALAALALACLAPLPAHAVVSEGCQFTRGSNLLDSYYDENVTGVEGIPKPLVPDIISLDKSTPAGATVYSRVLPVVPFTCVSNDPTAHPTLISGDGIKTAYHALQEIGLKLVITIDGFGDWEPADNRYDNRFPLINLNYKANPLSGGRLTTSHMLKGTLKLVVVTPPTKPMRRFILRNSDMVRVIPTNSATATNYVNIGSSNDTAVSIIPPCIAKILTPDTVYLGRAYSAGNLPLPSKSNFTLHADFNESCDGGINIADLGGDIIIPLKVMFQPVGNTELTALSEGIVLKNIDGDLNGLELRLRQGGSIPIKFNQWVDESTALTVKNNPLPLYYSAELTKSGRPLVPGKFQQQVTVQVTFQ
ncbi:hypothetical protein [Achromobacter xylosoxidans]|uniref:Fimbrial-type adhesion domain-containing protein n=1 Tax=Alcaligenes xylosoxydans xylosoxydans TaxID=85698 RepID=A0A1R1JZ75_ALCXX|nr:hypothetical protein [Achromobacter xylosoxidans]OMG92434.1 hypothetical protein BIZ92_07040 [Achromobacter xylosoxidans]BEG75634.1 hypothetical protein HBIAX_02701 [Achromobacter xylosoxidans]